MEPQHWYYETTLQKIWDIETSIGLVWYFSVRDDFRHMWE